MRKDQGCARKEPYKYWKVSGNNKKTLKTYKGGEERKVAKENALKVTGKGNFQESYSREQGKCQESTLNLLVKYFKNNLEKYQTCTGKVPGKY